MNNENPLNQIPNIEESNEQRQQMSAQNELAIIKSGYYSVRANLDLSFEQTTGQLYAKLLETNQINQALQKEIATLKKQLEEIKSKPQKTDEVDEIYKQQLEEVKNNLGNPESF